jgi:hypothetical protein
MAMCPRCKKIDLTRKPGHRCGILIPKYEPDEIDRIDREMERWNTFNRLREELGNDR